MSRTVRTLLVVLAALAVWLVAWPASAAAPLCDDRGASGFAPPPTLDTPNASVDVGMSPDACTDGVERDVSVHQGRAADPLPSSPGADVLPADDRVGVTRCGVVSRPVMSTENAVHRGVRERLERPPRGCAFVSEART
jgi:hypothetical protein